MTGQGPVWAVRSKSNPLAGPLCKGRNLRIADLGAQSSIWALIYEDLNDLFFERQELYANVANGSSRPSLTPEGFFTVVFPTAAKGSLVRITVDVAYCPEKDVRCRP